MESMLRTGRRRCAKAVRRTAAEPGGLHSLGHTVRRKQFRTGSESAALRRTASNPQVRGAGPCPRPTAPRGSVWTSRGPAGRAPLQGRAVGARLMAQALGPPDSQTLLSRAGRSTRRSTTPPGPRHPKPTHREGVSTPRTRAWPSPTLWTPGSTLAPSAHLGGPVQLQQVRTGPQRLWPKTPGACPSTVPEGQLPGGTGGGRTAAHSHACNPTGGPCHRPELDPVLTPPGLPVAGLQTPEDCRARDARGPGLGEDTEAEQQAPAHLMVRS